MTNELTNNPNARRARNTVSEEYATATDRDAKEETIINRILRNAERKGILEYAQREIANCVTYKQYKEVEENVWDYFPPSAKQIALAERLAEELKIDTPVPSYSHGMQFFSNFIDRCIQASDRLPVTEAQQEVLQGMYWCPDVPNPRDEKITNRGEAKEFIRKYESKYELWKQTRLSPNTLYTLRKLFKRVEGKEYSEDYLMQYDEKHAKQMIAQLEREKQYVYEKSAEAELNEIFRQFFIDEDNEERNELSKLNR